MAKRLAWWGVAAMGLALLAGAGWLLSLPPAAQLAAPAPVPAQEMADTLAALKPPKRARPVVAIIGANDGTETTDYLMPYGILRRANVAEVVALGMEEGAVRLYPALTVQPQETVADFDARYPDGADYVIVPAMKRDDQPAVLNWIRQQAGKGAIIVGVCAGAKVVANAGLLEGKRATTHWYYVKELRKRHPSIRYVPDRRYVADGAVVTSTGISASLPLSLALIEAIAGRQKAQDVASDLGVRNWDPRHDSSAFRFTRPFAWTALRNRLAFWQHETLGIKLSADVDEVRLALVADAWSRTFRTRVQTVGAGGAAVTARNGLRIHVDRRKGEAGLITLPSPADQTAIGALERTLGEIARRYGTATANMVAMQLEYLKNGG